ncbi:MAG: EAL domain-containing protein [Lachnospiraceae bacterium]|nr:EAL domain-containing protein [Lachnospiraceae bacterium]
MQYNVDFEIIALVFLLVISVHFFGKYKFPSMQNIFFGVIVICGIASITLDIITAYTIEHSYEIPELLNIMLNTAYYFMQLGLTAVTYLYVLCLTDLFQAKHWKWIAITLIPVGIFALAVLFNPITKQFFYFDNLSYYVKKDAVNYLYLISALYFVLMIAVINRYRENIRQIEYETVVFFIILVSGASAIQYIYPIYLVSGVAIALSIVMMFLTLQNPDEMLDELTGLFNRGCFLSYLRTSLEKEQKYNLVVIGIDGMRIINNMFGLYNGNEVIIQVAEFVKSSANSMPTFRVIGDQIAVVCNNKEECQRLVEKIETRFKDAWNVNTIDINLSVCMCYAMDLECDYKAAEIMLLVEYMLVRAKKQGPGTILRIDSAACKLRKREIDVETALYEVIEQNTLEVYFQPIFTPSKNAFTSAEALTRFYHKKLGFISPNEFIPLAEKKGLIGKIGEQIFEKVCQIIKEYRLEEQYNLRSIEVNLSAVELMQEQLADKLISTINRYQITPGFINFEITETVATTSYTTTKHNMDIMIQHGIKFAMDDFGTGYANVDSVINLPFSTVKIDRSMLIAGFQNKKSFIMLQRNIELIQELELEIVIEGAETLEQIEMLNHIGVDHIQGFYYARPMPIKQFIDFISR